MLENLNQDDNNIEQNNKPKTLKQEVIEFFKDLVIIIIIVLFVRTFLILPFQIS